jgi:Trypsin-co-occurring domain 1
MARAVKIRIGGREFLAETDESVVVPQQPDGAPEAPSGVPRGFAPVVNLTALAAEFIDVNDVIVSCCRHLFKAVEDIPEPQKISIEFGIKLAGAAGIPMLTSASGEGSFKVAVEWVRPGKP